MAAPANANVRATEPSPNGDEMLVGTEWLAASLAAPDVRVVDASWYLPDAGRDAKAEYREAHIPGAVFFDIEGISDDKSSLPHMLPSPEKFSSRVRRLGLGDGTRIVVYDGGPMYGAARAWWMFRTMGHRDVAVLDGGLSKWRADGHPLEDLPPMPRERHFTARVNGLLVRDRDQMLANLETGREQVVDARSAARFAGTAPEPRPGLRAGHIPGSRNLPWDRLLRADGTLHAPAEIAALFAAAGITADRPVVTTCGSGMSAALLLFALARIGRRDVALYDGSWSEWGADPALPVATGD
jgi:thiosulfate/3-mercaptopyruvate sulfurtransferase